MKKIFAFILTAALVVSSLTMMVGAADLKSPETSGIVVSANAKDKKGKVVKVNINQAKTGASEAFNGKLDELKKSTGKVLKIVDVREISSDDQAEFPVTITFNLIGVKDTDKGYFLLTDADGNVEVIEAIMGNNVMTGEFSKYGTVAFVLDSSVADNVTKDDNATSPKTADNTSVFALVALVISAAVVALSIKKINTVA